MAGLLASAAFAATLRGQLPGGAADPQEDVFQPAGFGTGPHAEVSVLLEVTIFKIDVLVLTVRVPDATAARFRDIVAGRDYGEDVADSIAAAVLDAEDLWARQVFRRDVSLGRLVGGMRENVERAAEAGYVTREFARTFAERLPEWFAFLADTGVKKGDEIVFRVRGDSLRTVYRTVGGEVMLDEWAEGTQARRGSVPSFFAPGTRFRKRLVEALLRATPRPSSAHPATSSTDPPVPGPPARR